MTPVEEIADGLDDGQVAGPPPSPALATVLLLALVAPALNMTLLPPALPMIADFLGGGVRGEVLAQQAQALPFLGLAVGGLLAGGVIDRLGLKRCVVWMAVLYAGGALVAQTAAGAAQLLLGCLIVGLSGSVLTSVLSTASGAVYHGPRRAKILGFQVAVSDFGAISVGVLAAVLAGNFGWRGPFTVYVLFGAIVLLLASRVRWPLQPRSDGQIKGLLAVTRAAGSTYLAGFCIMFLLSTGPTLLPFHLAANGLDTPESRAVVLVSTPFLAMLTAIIYALLRDRISDRMLLLTATVISAVGYAGIAAWSGGVTPVTLASAATGIGVGLAFPMTFRAAFRRTPPSLHGYSIGVLNTANFAGAFVSPLLLGPIMRGAGAETMYLICAAGWIVCGVFAASRVSGRPRSDDTSLADTVATA